MKGTTSGSSDDGPGDCAAARVAAKRTSRTDVANGDLGFSSARLGARPYTLQQTIHLGPIDHVPPGGEVVGSAILILEIVGVLPDIHAEDGLLAVHQRVVLIGRADDLEFPAVVDQPRPAAAEARETRSLQ